MDKIKPTNKKNAKKRKKNNKPFDLDKVQIHPNAYLNAELILHTCLEIIDNIEDVTVVIKGKNGLYSVGSSEQDAKELLVQGEMLKSSAMSVILGTGEWGPPDG